MYEMLGSTQRGGTLFRLGELKLRGHSDLKKVILAQLGNSNTTRVYSSMPHPKVGLVKPLQLCFKIN